MVPSTALALVLSGVAASLRIPESPGRARRIICSATGAVVLAFGVLTIVEYMLGGTFVTDRLRSAADTLPFPGRPSPPVGAAFALLGAALLSFDARPRAHLTPRCAFALSVGFIALVTLVGHAYGAGQLYVLEGWAVRGTALPTSLALLLIAIGLVLARPDVGVMRLATSRSPAGVLLRRLGLASIVVPPLLGLVVHEALAAIGVRDVPLTLAVLTTSIVPVTVLLVVLTSIHAGRVHEELEANRAQLRALFDRSADAIFVSDLEGHYLDVNENACRLLGYARDELLAMRIIDVVPPERAEGLASMRERLLGGGSELSEWSLRRKDGSTVPVELNTTILPDGRWQAVVRDITERRAAEAVRKRLEEDLVRSRESFRMLAENAPDLIYRIRLRPTPAFDYVSPAATALTGYTPEEHYADPALGEKIVHPADRPLLDPVLEGRRMDRPLELRLVRKDGTIRWTEQRNAGVFGPNGELLALEGIVRDITERKRTEMEQQLLARSGDALGASLDPKQVAESAAELCVEFIATTAIVELVEDGHVVARRVRCRDREHAALARRLESSVAGRRAIPELDALVLAANVTDEVLRQIAASDDDFDALRALAARSLVAVPIATRGKRFGRLVLLSSDNSFPLGSHELRVAVEIARRTALTVENATLYVATQRAVRARDEVLAIVAHDLRNPLNGILLNAQLLSRRFRDAPSTDRDAIEAIGRQSKRMDRLIQDLLDVARVESSALAIACSRVPVEALLTEVIEAQDATATAASTRLRLDVQGHPSAVWGDHDRLVQVFDNLIGNAVKFTSEGGVISIGAAAKRDETLFWVADSGPGIPAAAVPHLFDRFWQASRTDRRGAGLGLAIVKGIVETHGGRVWVESEPGAGTTFFFTVPTVERAESHPDSGDTASAARQRCL
jgi:PAS domain S-box-containing protein